MRRVFRPSVLIALIILIIIFSAVILQSYLNSKKDIFEPSVNNLLVEQQKESTDSAELEVDIEEDPNSPLNVLKMGIKGEITAYCSVASDDIKGGFYIHGDIARFVGTIHANELYDEMTDLLLRESTVYMWNSKAKQGYSMKSFSDVSQDSQVVESIEDSDFSKAMEYLGLVPSTCVAVSYDATIFEIPDDVSFVSFQDRIGDYIKEQIQKSITDGYKLFFP